MMRWMPAFLLPFLAVLPVHAQVIPAGDTPQISTGGSVEVVVPASRAMITFALSGEGMDGTEAAKALDSLRARVTALLRPLKVEAVSYGAGVGENQQVRRMLPNQPEVRTSRDFLMRAGAVIDIPDVAKVPAILAALAAAGVKGPLNAVYFGRDDDPRLQEGLTKAVEQARAEAQVLAVAAGGRIGRMRSLWRQPGFGQSSLTRMGMMDSSGVPVPPGETIVRIIVQGTWEFIPGL